MCLSPEALALAFMSGSERLAKPLTQFRVMFSLALMERMVATAAEICLFLLELSEMTI